MNKLRRQTRTTTEEPTINLTPLIDVVFVVLIMFILVAPLLEIDRIELADAAQTETTSNVEDKSPVTIHVRKDNTILLNQHPVNASELPKVLKDARNRFPHARPQLFQDQSATFGTYQTVKNAVEQAGFSELDVVLKPV